MRRKTRQLAPWALVMAACWLLPNSLAADQEHWLLIDTASRTLNVMRGDDSAFRFEGISVGRNGTTNSKTRGDGKTPLGVFHVTGMQTGKDTRFHRFIAVDYPGFEDARRAFASGTISVADMNAIRTAHEHGQQPPASTPLGGAIGIHGIGDGDPRIHQDFNWTDGCVALTNDEVDELARWIRVGMVVLIR